MAKVATQPNIFQRLLYGSVPPYRGTREASPLKESASIRASWVFDSHRTTYSESAAGNGKGPQAVSLAWDETAAWGSDEFNRTWEGLDARQQKEIFLAMYLANPWVSACVDVIAKRITSGGFVIEPTVEKPDESHYDTLMAFLLRINPDWDFLQYTRAVITDEEIFGEGYSEIVPKDGGFNPRRDYCLFATNTMAARRSLKVKFQSQTGLLPHRKDSL